MTLPDLFPYKIKNRNLFLDRDHESVSLLQHADYWDTQIKRCIEGYWVDDNGTWVYMMPKLYFHINVFVANVTDDYGNRVIGKLDLTDREWIIYTYLFCCMGFSGFTDDEDYTCHHLVGKKERGENLTRVDNMILERSSVYNKKGKLKKYIEPWEYLTNHYLIKDKRNKPLGLPFYENPLRDGFIFGTRGSAKTYTIGSAMAHEFFTGGVRRWDDAHLIGKNRQIFGIGSADLSKVDNFADCIKVFYTNMPGIVKGDGIEIPSPLYRKIIGSWGDGILSHEYRTDGNEIRGSLSKIIQGVYKVNRHALFVGDRYRFIVEDEVGLNPGVEKTRIAEAPSMIDKATGRKVGISIRMGTSGFIEFIEGCKNLFYHPEMNGIFGIPNLWEKPDQSIGLFLPDYYVNSLYKDENGNTFIQEAYEASVKIVEDMIAAGMPGNKIREHELNNPNWPSQMFIDGKTSILPSELMRMRRVELESIGVKREIGDLERIGGKVHFTVNPRGIVVDNYTTKTTKIEKNTSVSIYEKPLPVPGLYKGVYDPVRSDGLGVTDDASMCAVIIYKGLDFTKSGIQNNIVATWLFRKETLDANHACALMLADYYGCKILHEDDVGDFTGYCRRINRMDALASTPVFDNNIKISGNSIFKVGIKVGDNPEFKSQMLMVYAEWLETETGGYKEGGAPLRNVDGINDLRILDEGASYGLEGNFDMTSAMLVLMAWIRSETMKVYNVEDSKKRTNNMRELYKLAMKNLGYVEQYA